MSEGNPYEEDDSSKLAGELFGGQLGLHEALSKLRTRLLDLSMRNRLLNYRQPKGRSFQYTDDPDLNLVYERLQDGRSVPMLYVPDPPISRYDQGKKPEARAYAREVNIGVSPDIAPSRSSTAYKRLQGLQVLQYPADLERAARKVYSEARTVIEETGTNMLYLIFGFLEYFESDDSTKAVLAPLLSMPVALNKGSLDPESRTYLYELTHSGEDIAENFTLREKMRQLFRLELPELGEEDTPEMYFEAIQAAVSKKRNWVVRRRLTLGFLSFGKLAIWADLDPDNAKGLLSSDLLRNIFEGGRAGPSDSFHAEDYDIDSHADAELPLIYDADSSQHSALIDVKNGKNLVINGPPGTGKSQTITNIVATAIAQGKKVLFVSEKLAALEVVKQRLEAAGLGDFCLELHSHKTQKKQLLESIEQRLAKRFSAPAGYTQRVDVLRERRKLLNSYAQLLGGQLDNNLELTVHDVFWATELKRQALGSSIEGMSGLTLMGASDWSPEKVDRCKMILLDASTALAEMRCAPHEVPWMGFTPGLLIKGDELPILDVVGTALSHAQTMSAAAKSLDGLTPGSRWTIAEFKKAHRIIDSLSSVDETLNSVVLARMFRDGIGSLERVKVEALRLRTSLANIRELQANAAVWLLTDEAIDEAAFGKCAGLVPVALKADAPALASEELVVAAQRLEVLLAEVQGATQGRATKIPEAPAAAQLKAYCDASETVSLASLPAARVAELCESAFGSVQEFGAILEQVTKVLEANRIGFQGRIEEVQNLLDGKGMPELLPNASEQSGAHELLRQLASNGWHDWTAGQFSSTTREISELLADTAQAVEELKAFFSRLSLPVDSTKSSLSAIETLLTVAEEAPKDVLAYRSPGFERQDFADTAIKAEDAHKSLLYKAGKVSAAFHLDTLPEEEGLRTHVRVFRRGDSLFNFLKSDWRAAKAAFSGCAKAKQKLDAHTMGEQFGAVLSWKIAQQEFEQEPRYREMFGSLFEGMKTDFSKARRLHGWLRSSQSTLLGCDLGQHVNLNTISEQHVALLTSNATRVRSWMAKINELSTAVKNLPGIDPALARSRRIEDLFNPLQEYLATLTKGGAALQATVRPTASVHRAVELLELQKQIRENADILRQLVAAPVKLAQVGAALHLASSPLAYQHLKTSLLELSARAKSAQAMAETVTMQVGDSYSAREAHAVVKAIAELEATADNVLSSDGLSKHRQLSELLAMRTKQVAAALEIGRYFSDISRSGTTLANVMAAAQSRKDAARALSTIHHDSSLQNLFSSSLNGVATDEAAIWQCIDWSEVVKDVARSLPTHVANNLLSERAPQLGPALASALTLANRALVAYEAAMDGLNQWGTFDWLAWGGSPLATDAVVRLERAQAGGDKLIAWSRFLMAQTDASANGVSEILGRAEQGKLAPDMLVAGFEYVFYRTLSRRILSSHSELARFSGTGHESLRSEFSQLDRELVSLNGTMYASKVDSAKKMVPGVGYGRAGELTEMALLTKEVKKQKRHIPIRQLLKRAGKSLQQLKPCFMMGPLSVAQYLEQGHLKFDLIVMDEASQLRPEDALGAISRGSQLVVVGDPKQLPPTNFFDRLMDDDADDADEAPAIVEGVESILGICEHLYRPVRTLRWHYRSRHESLIAFSNSQFYDHRLVVFPSPYKRNKKLGVNYRYVSEGEYQDRRNIPEARRVVDAVLEHMLTSPEESLGVVTLNQTQRELIEDMLDQKMRSVAGAAEYIDKHEKAGWPFFIKNLENVQGDERDVIFVSTTFGKPPGSSSVRQNFGPINRADGWRRLNVLFTRSRRRIDLFSSLLPNDVRVDEKASAGRRALHDYLEYARTGNLPGVAKVSTGRDADSDFEVAVANALRAQGYETEPQVGVAGYFIDLGVRHPVRRGEFLAGIECDGATYHGSLSARDRDRIRHEILESLGWRGRIIRVWSTDWFADPIGQTARLAKFLDQRRVDDEAEPPPYSDEDLEETRDVEEASPTPQPAEDEHQKADASPPSKQVDDAPEIFVELGDRVVYETMTEPLERHAVQIVDSPSNLKLGLINDQTPLAQALMGLCAGDDAELKIKEQPVRKMRVVQILRQPMDVFPIGSTVV